MWKCEVILVLGGCKKNGELGAIGRYLCLSVGRVLQVARVQGTLLNVEIT